MENTYANHDTLPVALDPPLFQDRINLELISTAEKRQLVGAISTAALALLVAATVWKGNDHYDILMWVALVFMASCYKALPAWHRFSSSKLQLTLLTRQLLLLISAALTGILWSIPIFFVANESHLEQTTVVLIVSGIMSGAVGTYLGKFPCMIFTTIPPTSAIIYWMFTRITPTPYEAIASIVIYDIFLMIVCRHTFENATRLIRLRFQNIDLIEELEGAHIKMRELANRDELTGLPNRRLLSEFFKHSIREANRNKSKIAILFIDINEFKLINDIYGHDIGDQSLVYIANTVKGCIREVDILARLGGDEFVAVLNGITSANDAISVAQKVTSALSKPVNIQNCNVNLNASIGISMYPDHAGNLSDLLIFADAAMYDAKGKKTDHYAVHSPD